MLRVVHGGAKFHLPKSRMTQALNSGLSAEQQSQEDQYEFPYHHVPRIDKRGFSPLYSWNWAVPYLGGMKFLQDKLAALPFVSLVDIGCGDGRLIKELFQAFPHKRLLGLDYSERAIRYAQAFCPGAEFRQEDILRDSPEEQFDIVTMVEVYEHIPPEMCKSFLGAAVAFLKEGGTFVLTVPHKNAPLPDKHYRHFDSATLQAELGIFFENVEIVPFDKRPLLFRVLNAIGNQIHIRGQYWLNNWRWNYYTEHCLEDVAEADCHRVAAFCSVRRSGG
jgi:2-polyprenyl-3-methyl-5-hydroxy-6-metoxy-1,4-benzoquinol methylase